MTVSREQRNSPGSLQTSEGGSLSAGAGGFAPAPLVFVLWALYLSLTGAGQIFLGYQWDALLLETGFLAVFFAPLGLRPRPGRASPSVLVLWLLRWLLCRLMFSSGVVKLLSDDPTWRDLTALRYHYWTQPLLAWPAWFLPSGEKRGCEFFEGMNGLAQQVVLAAPGAVVHAQKVQQGGLAGGSARWT